MSENIPFSQWLKQKYLEWQVELGELKTRKDFADYLGVSDQLLGQWFRGKYEPGSRSAKSLAEKLGDEVYKVLGIPNPEVNEIVERWNALAPEVRKQIIEIVRTNSS